MATGVIFPEGSLDHGVEVGLGNALLGPGPGTAYGGRKAGEQSGK